ncbi:Mn2+/Fe2+ NRAMP family transporter [Burkholderia ambifaria]|nr:Mn2+/Fe2+ NRAMP family transporter [Burkholderia ambifaria]
MATTAATAAGRAHRETPDERPAPRPAAAKPRYRRLGPGLLAGASAAAPSNVAVYAQAGSQFGFNMRWMVVGMLT